MKIFGREPALLLGFIAALLKLAAGFGVEVSETQMTLINAFLAAAVAVILAVVLRDGAAGAAIMQFAQAGMALFVGFGLDWTAEKQALVMASLAALLALWERREVVPPVRQVKLETKSPLDKRAHAA